MIREAAREAMRGRMSVLVASAAAYMLCLSLPVIVVEQIMGFWDRLELAMQEYMALLENPTMEAANEWAQAWGDSMGLSYASFIFLLVVPGPLTLGLSVIWLRVIRGKDVHTDMVFSGFGSFLQVFLMDTVRRVMMFLWAILLVVPGIIAYYRYSLAFFLIADNPGMRPFEALSLSKYYMQQNKGGRFVLDLSLIGWFAASFIAYLLVSSGFLAVAGGEYQEASLFSQRLISGVVSAFVFAPVCAYRGVVAAEYYHRVTCQDPSSFMDAPELPGPGVPHR